MTMKIQNSTRSGIDPLLFFGILIMAGLLLGCQAIIKNTQSKKNKNPNGRNDTWGFAGYGGGGAMFNPAVSPHDPNYAFVACDMTGSFVTYNGGQSWRMFSLRGPVKLLSLLHI